MYDLIQIENVKDLENINFKKFNEEINKLEQSKTNIIYIYFDEKPYIEKPYIINPIFLILLLNYHNKFGSKQKIFLDITNLHFKTQYTMITHLKQYSDYGIINKKHTNKIKLNSLNDKYYNSLNRYEAGKINLIYSTTYKYYEGIVPILMEKADLSNLTNLELKYKDENSKEYDIDISYYHKTKTNKINLNYLPIINITNLEEPEDFGTSDDPENNLYNLYIQTKIDYNHTGYKIRDIWDKIFFTYLNLSAKNDNYTLNAFKNIIIEAIGNIQEHTNKNNTNGYISFFRNTNTNMNEFYICDNYEEGFLESYLITLKKEKKKVENIIRNRTNTMSRDNDYNDIINDYNNDINILEKNKKENDIEILKKLFDFDSISNMHKASRMIMHFGIPTLIKILKELDKNKSTLDIYLHRSNRTYHIQFKNNKIHEPVCLEEVSIKGTYIYVSFPIGSNIEEKSNNNHLNINIATYQEIFKEKKSIKNRVNELKINKQIIKYNNDNISEFLRSIYKTTFEKNIKDILVINFPTKKYETYLKILIDILYPKVKEYKNDSLNIVFLNDTIPQALFIGGKNQEELCSMNYLLSKTYNYDKYDFTNHLNVKSSKDTKINSELFYKTKDNNIFIPFELFCKNNKDEYIYTDMIKNYLELKDNYEKIHIKINDNLHLDRFYYIKNIFENSQWIDLIAFNLSRKIENIKKEKKDITLVGLDLYSSFLLAKTKYILGDDINIYIIEDLLNENIKQNFRNYYKNNKDAHFIIFRPIIFEYNEIEELIQDIDKYELITSIKLITNTINHQSWDSLFSFDIDKYVTTKQESCTLCFKDFKKEFDEPLYKLSKNKYNIANLYPNIDKKENIDQEVMNFDEIKWKNSIYFQHIERNTNHYLYYIKTIEFFKINKNNIESFLSKYTINKDDNYTNIILAPNHNTNTKFITLVNHKVFNNNAIVHIFDLTDKEKTLNLINNSFSQYEKNEKLKFYYVDDEISSGDTLIYFYNILSKITDNGKFDAIFTLIDRTTLEEKNNVLSKYYKKLYSFCRLNIHPIKTGFEECYLCKRKKYLENLSKNSSLIFVKSYFKSKIDNNSILYLTKSDNIEYTEIYNKNESKDFKNYLKMYSTEFIYKNLNSNFDINKKLNEFFEIIFKYFKNNYLDCELEVLKNIIYFEAKVSFLKSLSFPKILFYKDIREKIHEYISNELYNIIKKEISIKDKANVDDLKYLSFYTEIYSDYKRNNIDEFNFLLTTGSYLGTNIILSYDMLKYYFNLTKYIKDENYYNKYKGLLSKYPIAVKQMIYNSKINASYFHKNLHKFNEEYPFSYNRWYSRIFGMYVENVELIDSNINIDISKVKTLEKIQEIRDQLNRFIRDDDYGKYDTEDIKIVKFYININDDTNNPELIDILSDNYDNVKENSYEEILYKGASVKDITFDDNIEIEYNKDKDKDKDKDNIWSNYLHANCTYVRLTNNKLKPFGVIVVEHKKEKNLILHLKISRRILFKQNEIVNIFKKNELLSQIRQKNISNSEQKQKNIYKIRKASHGANDNIRRCIENFKGDDTTFKHVWLASCNIKLWKLYEENINIFNENCIKVDIKKNNEIMKYLSKIEYDKYLEININETYNTNIKEEYICVFITILINNALFHKKYDTKVELYINNNKIKIKNVPRINDSKKIQESINKLINTEPYVLMDENENMKPGITMYTLNKYLKDILEIKIADGLFEIIIKGKNNE